MVLSGSCACITTPLINPNPTNQIIALKRTPVVPDPTQEDSWVWTQDYTSPCALRAFIRAAPASASKLIRRTQRSARPRMKFVPRPRPHPLQ